MAFHEVRFPTALSFGSVGGPERRTEIVALTNGFEERNTPWAQSRRRYDAGLGMRSLDDLADLIAFFEARQGQLHGFRWKDWSDFKSCLPSQSVGFDDQVLGSGDGTTRQFRLKKRYTSGGVSVERVIAKPVSGTVRVGLGGIEAAAGVDYLLDVATGLVTFTVPPETGVAVTAGFEFDVPVRFDTDAIRVSVATFEAGEIPQVPVIEVRI